MADQTWKPHTKQEHFMKIPDDIFEALYGGAAGGGKSELLLMLPLARGWYKNPRFRGLMLRRTYPELEESLIARSKNYYPMTGGTYVQQFKRWEWPWGAVIKFGYAQHMEDVRQYDTTEYQYLAIDELTSFTEWMYRYLTSRCRSTVSGIPSVVRAASNPGNVGHGWVRKRFVEPCADGYTVIRGRIELSREKTVENKRIFIPAKLTDNPYLAKEDPNYAARLAILPFAERKAKLDGDWWTFSGQVFDEWRDAPMPDEPPNALHVIDPFPIPAWWPQVLAIDWGFTAMLCALWFAIAPNKRVYIHQEYTSKKEKIALWADKISQMSESFENLKTIVLDPSAWHQRGDEKTIADQFMQHSGMQCEKADNDRLGGKMLMHELLRWDPKPTKAKKKMDVFDADLAQRILRMKGLKEYESYVDSFIPEKPELDIPRLQIFNTCPYIIDTIPKCVYNTKEGKDPEDVAQFDGDDPYDCARYGLKAVDRYLNQSKSLAEDHDRRGKILAKFEKTHDYTYLHQQMDRLEARKRTQGTVLRYRHGYRRHRVA